MMMRHLPAQSLLLLEKNQLLDGRGKTEVAKPRWRENLPKKEKVQLENPIKESS